MRRIGAALPVSSWWYCLHGSSHCQRRGFVVANEPQPVSGIVRESAHYEAGSFTVRGGGDGVRRDVHCLDCPMRWTWTAGWMTDEGLADTWEQMDRLMRSGRFKDAPGC